MALKDKIMVFLVLGALICGFAFNMVVLGSCEYLEDSSFNLELGVYRYNLRLAGSEFDTGGDCVEYPNELQDASSRTAQVCAVLAPIFGLIVILLVFVTQCCRPIPCTGIVVSIGYIGMQICTALVWFMYQHQVCELREISCDWGQAASTNILAQIMYLVAAILHKCMPSPKEMAASRRAEAAEKKEKDAVKRAEEAEDRAREAEQKAQDAIEKQKSAEEGTSPAKTIEEQTLPAQTY